MDTTQSLATSTAKTMQVPPETTTESTPHKMSALRQVTSAETAPNIRIRISTINGSTVTSVLPDSGADISTAGLQLLPLLDEHQLNLLSSSVSPQDSQWSQDDTYWQTFRQLLDPG